MADTAGIVEHTGEPEWKDFDAIVNFMFPRRPDDGSAFVLTFRLTRPTAEQWDIIMRGVEGSPYEKVCSLLLFMAYKHTKDQSYDGRENRHRVKKARDLAKVEMLFDSDDPETLTGLTAGPVRYAMIVIPK